MTTKKNKTKFGLNANAYRLPTPTKWRRIGDALLIGSTLVSSQTHSPTIALVSQVLGVVGKFLTNFFHD